MIDDIRYIMKPLNLETRKSIKGNVKGCKNVGSTKGINICKDKFNEDEVLIKFSKLDNKTIDKIVKTLADRGYKSTIVPGIIIVSLA
jgi:hypothetical protein